MGYRHRPPVDTKLRGKMRQLIRYSGIRVMGVKNIRILNKQEGLLLKLLARKKNKPIIKS